MSGISRNDFPVRIAADAENRRRTIDSAGARTVTTDDRKNEQSVWWVSGLRVATDRPLVELEPCDDGEADLQVLFRADPGSEVEVGVLSSADSSGDWFKLMDQEAALAWIRADGRLVLVAEAEALVQGFDVLVRRVVPFAAALQDRVMLHASAVLVDGAVHAFIGASGVGKSTLAERLGEQGLPVLSEDLLLCLPTDSGVVIPGSQAGSVGESGPSLEAVYFIERMATLKGSQARRAARRGVFQALAEARVRRAGRAEDLGRTVRAVLDHRRAMQGLPFEGSRLAGPTRRSGGGSGRANLFGLRWISRPPELAAAMATRARPRTAPPR